MIKVFVGVKWGITIREVRGIKFIELNNLKKKIEQNYFPKKQANAFLALRLIYNTKKIKKKSEFLPNDQ